MNERELEKARLLELDRLSYDRDLLKNSEFLDTAGQALYAGLNQSFHNPNHVLLGGHADADRCMAVFLPSYMTAEMAEAALISTLEILPVNAHFAEELSHRDYLGALMNLGIERGLIGDILVDRKSHRALLYCNADMSAYIAKSLSSVRHTRVEVRPAGEETEEIRPELEEMHVNVASVRLDAVIAAVFHISREKAQQLIGSELVFLSRHMAVQTSTVLKEEERVSVRGFGKFIFDGEESVTKKGRLYVKVRRFV